MGKDGLLFQEVRVPLTGDFAALGRLRSSLDRLARIPAKVARRVAPALTGQLQRQFGSGTDPYGKPWDPLKPSTVRRKGHATILVDTTAGRTGTRALVLPGAGVGIVLGPHLHWHLVRTADRAARPVLPLFGLPRAWSAIITRFTELEGKAALRG